MSIRIIGLSVLASTLLFSAGCAKVPMLPSLTPHKMDIRQGNYVTQEMVNKLKPGMTQKEVRFHLGTPLVVDLFRTDRWDYVYLYSHKGERVEQRRLVVLFSKDAKLLRLEGDVIPAKPKPVPVAVNKPKPAMPQPTVEAAKAAQPVTAPPDADATKSAADKPAEERGFFGRLLDSIGF
jgi:outer membrane protein assembly factor BamE